MLFYRHFPEPFPAFFALRSFDAKYFSFLLDLTFQIVYYEGYEINLPAPCARPTQGE
jgi:hypothetical protein